MSNTTKIAAPIKCHEITDNGLVYKYELIMHELRIDEANKSICYSISAELFSKDGERISRAETAAVFFSEEKAMRFFEKSADNLATPSNLPYVLEDAITI